MDTIKPTTPDAERTAGSLHRDGSADGVEEEKAALRTYRRIWERLPERLRHDMLASMRCWSPLDYEVMLAEEKRQNEKAQ